MKTNHLLYFTLNFEFGLTTESDILYLGINLINIDCPLFYIITACMVHCTLKNGLQFNHLLLLFFE